MKKLIKLFICACLLSTPLIAQPTQNNTTTSSQINWMRNYSDAVALSQSTSKPIAILFTGTGWCPACMKLEREVLANPEFTQSVGQKFVFLKADFPDYSESAISASPFKPLLDRYSVSAFPTIVVVNANGQKLHTVNYQQGGARVYAQELLKAQK